MRVVSRITGLGEVLDATGEHTAILCVAEDKFIIGIACPALNPNARSRKHDPGKVGGYPVNSFPAILSTGFGHSA